MSHLQLQPVQLLLSRSSRSSWSILLMPLHRLWSLQPPHLRQKTSLVGLHNSYLCLTLLFRTVEVLPG